MKYFVVLFLLLFGTVVLKSQNAKMYQSLYEAKLYDSILVLTAGKSSADWDTETTLYIGQSLSAKAKYEQAVPYYERSLMSKDKTTKGWAAANLGLHYYMTSRYDKSKAYFKQALLSKKSKDVVKHVEKEMAAFGLSEDYDHWTIEETEHLRVHFQDKTPVNRPKYAAGLEGAFKEINTFFGAEFPKKTDVFIWENPEEGKSLLGGPVGFTRPAYCLTHMHHKQTRGHELTHTISHFYQKPIEKTRFINEGIAVYFDLSKSDRLELARTAVVTHNVAVNLKDMWNLGRQVNSNILYPVSGAFIQMLLENGTKEQFLQLVPNQTYEQAKKIYGDPLDAWIKALEERLNG